MSGGLAFLLGACAVVGAIFVRELVRATAPWRAARGRARAAARRLRDDARARGGSPGNPAVVATPAMIEGRARSMGCPACGGSVRVEGHVARGHGAALLRVVRVRCPRCDHAAERYFRVDPGGSA